MTVCPHCGKSMTAKSAEKMARIRLAAKKRENGKPYQQIADEIGVSAVSARSYVQDAVQLGILDRAYLNARPSSLIKETPAWP